MPAGLNWEFATSSLAFKIRAAHSSSRTPLPTKFNYEFKIYVCRQVLFIGCGWFLNLHKQSACSGEQAANRSAGCQRSPTFGSRTCLQLWIDGSKVANIGRGQRYGDRS